MFLLFTNTNLIKYDYVNSLNQWNFFMRKSLVVKSKAYFTCNCKNLYYNTPYYYNTFENLL